MYLQGNISSNTKKFIYPPKIGQKIIKEESIIELNNQTKPTFKEAEIALSEFKEGLNIDLNIYRDINKSNN